MVNLMKWIRAAIIAALLNETIKSALMSRVMKSFNGTARKSAGGNNQEDGLRTLLEAALAFMLLRLRKGNSSMQPAMVPIIAALLTSLIEPAIRHHEQGQEKRKQVIDVDDYSIIDEK